MTPFTPFAPLQLAACLQRLGLPPEPPRATAATLDRLIDAALHHLPFENLDVLLGHPVSIDPEAVYAKLVENRRGGYCFELNGLFARLLASLGYRTTLLVGRVRWGCADDAPMTAQSHLMLRIDLDRGPHLVDIGFGAAAAPRALPLTPGVPLPQGWRLAPTGIEGELDLGLCTDSGWHTLYRFTLAPQYWVDYHSRNWYTSTHPHSPFRQSLMAALSEHGHRLALNNGQLTRRAADGSVVERQQLETPEALLSVLQGRFGLRLPDGVAAALRGPLSRVL